MAVIIEGFEYVANCDGCLEQLRGGDEDDSRLFGVKMQDAGWKAKELFDTWEYYCQKCSEERGM